MVYAVLIMILLLGWYVGDEFGKRDKKIKELEDMITRVGLAGNTAHQKINNLEDALKKEKELLRR